MENIRRVLESYHVYPVDINKVTERLFYIKGNNQSYALKKASIHDEKLPLWLEVYRTAQTQNLQNILPVYLNPSGNLYSMDGNDIYYLTPWIESTNRTQSIDKIYQNIGYIHAKTRKVQSISKEMQDSSRESFLIYKNNMLELRKNLLKYVEHFEAQHFMSPVELLVCTQYRDLVQVFYILERRLNQYLDALEELTEWKVSLCHGKLKDSHVLHGNQFYFTNWENASYEHPILDLTTIIQDKTLYHDTDKRLLLDKLKVYTDENKLESHELTLLTIYLLNPSNYLSTIESYVEARLEKSTIDYVIKLQRYHRQLVFGVAFSEFIEEEFEMVPLDESISES
ncbi:phosphotransferase [Paucisalibacillus globulus]|uniref:phosphotransferase n=1 Tax=Paucisalibacillus globulus TaxID=351095 RepID=UPI000415C166|nr:phosphotransferase [Paucisalibacillus globulus]